MRKLLWVLWPLGMVPLGWIVWLIASGGLGPDPAKELVELLGWWGLVLLCLCLTARPLAVLTSTPALVPARRTFGLLAFGYLTLHFAAWAGLLLGLDFSALGGELKERPFIWVGFLAWLCLCPLAATSSRKMRRKLGATWGRIHQLIFPAVLAGLVHQVWAQKSAYGESLVFACVIFGLLGWRLWHARQRAKQRKVSAD